MFNVQRVLGQLRELASEFAASLHSLPGRHGAMHALVVIGERHQHGLLQQVFHLRRADYGALLAAVEQNADAIRQIHHAQVVQLLRQLGGAEGGVGWWMVKSGLVNDPMVSPYRLATHLGLAAIIYSALLLTGLRLIWRPQQIAVQVSGQVPGQVAGQKLHRWSFVLIGLVFTTLLAGALVAGLDAGLIYNTFPLMNGSIVPPDALAMKPLWRNLFENPATVQFLHRLLALLSFTAILCFFLMARRQPLPHRASLAWRSVVALALAQVLLGIGTLLLNVPVLLASLHQMGALLLLGSLVVGQEALRQEIRQDRRFA